MIIAVLKDRKHGRIVVQKVDGKLTTKKVGMWAYIGYKILQKAADALKRVA